MDEFTVVEGLSKALIGKDTAEKTERVKGWIIKLV